ncbi:MAG: hypothetical protein RLZZ175_698 [Bacteroidota bacterium]|jgi:Holliday junction DNA helicase RuvA
MIAYISGKLTYKDPTAVIIETNGVGYFIKISLNTYGHIAAAESCKLLTVLNIKEDAHTLYGFFEAEEKRLFLLLTSISGVGPSIALMVLSSMQSVEIQTAIANDDIRTLQSVKGIGLKTAQRIILELKDKINKENLILVGAAGLTHNIVRAEALSALQTLGIEKKLAEKSVDALLKENPSAKVEDLIRAALKAR